MYEDLADAVESLKDKGYTHTFEPGEKCVFCPQLDQEFPLEEIKIVKKYTFNQDTDPGNESSVFALESESGVKGTLIFSFGTYIDRDEAHVINYLLQNYK